MTHEYDIAVNAVLRPIPPAAIFAGRAVRRGGPGNEAKQIRVVADVHPILGEVWRVRGTWRHDPQYGWQLQAQEAQRTVPSGALVVPFLRRRLPEIGEARARRLRALGADLVPVLEAGNAGRIAAVIEPRFPALSARLAASILREWSVLRSEVEALDWMERNGVTDARIAMRVTSVLREHARKRLETNPYILASFLGWQAVEKVALPILNRTGRDAHEAPERLLGAVTSTVRDALQSGSTALTDAALRAGLLARLGPSRVARAIHVGERNLGIVRFPGGWRAPGCAAMEDALARRFAGLLADRERTRVQVPDAVALRGALAAVTRERGLRLSPEQQEAVLNAVRRPLSAIVGYAGCGKTTALAAICALWTRLGGRLEVAALSGIAALRATRATRAVTGRLARTIYRLLRELEAADADESRGERGRLDGRTLLVVDEASMVGLGDWYRLVRAMPPGCRLLMTGDPMQLPPIEFGLVFHKLADDDRIATRLTRVFRQDETTGIPMVAQAIRLGQEPRWAPYPGKRAPGASFVEAEISDIPATIARIAEDLGGFDRGERLIVLAPTKHGAHAVDGLNTMFHDRFVQPLLAQHGAQDVGAAEVRGYFGHRFAAGEPVLHVENDYKRGLFNGSLGRVERIDPDTRALVARFEESDEEQVFSASELIQLAPAYAVTCHKAQGSQVERVIVPVYDTGLLDRTWLYTAVTRAIHQVVLVGHRSVFLHALKRETGAQRRHTGFALPKTTA